MSFRFVIISEWADGYFVPEGARKLGRGSKVAAENQQDAENGNTRLLTRAARNGARVFAAGAVRSAV